MAMELVAASNKINTYLLSILFISVFINIHDFLRDLFDIQNMVYSFQTIIYGLYKL